MKKSKPASAPAPVANPALDAAKLLEAVASNVRLLAGASEGASTSLGE